MWIFVVFNVFFVTAVHGKSDTLKVCVPGNGAQKNTVYSKYCDLLGHSKKTQVSCVFGTDRLDCLRKVSERSADFTTLFAEDLLFAAQWKKCAVLVVSEIRGLQRYQYDSEGVVVVRNGVNNLRGAKLCHPGWANDPEKGNLFRQFLEERVAPQLCSRNKTMREDRIQTTANFFHSACKAGPWSSDNDEDRQLKAAYPSLCQLCDNPNSCSKSDKYWGPAGAAMCLQEGVGTVLWSKRTDVHIHFKLTTSSGVPSDINNNFQYLCENGSTQSLSTDEPCIWLARPWPVIVASGKNSLEVQKMLRLVQEGYNSEWQEHLIAVLESYMETIVNLETTRTPADYLNSIPGYLSAMEMAQMNCVPHHGVRWCTKSRSEQNKCTWMARAARAYALRPPIDCIEKNNIDQCFDALSADESDIVVVTPDYQPMASLYYNLDVLMYEKSKTNQDNYGVVAVVKRESPIKKASHLRDSRVCFTVENGAAWRSVLLRLGNCEEHMADIFGNVCVTEKRTNQGSALQSCCADKYSDQDADSAAFRCLLKDGCDVAFIKSNTLYSILDGNTTEPWAEHIRKDDYRVVCAGEKATECSWTNSPPSAIMMAQNASHLKVAEALNILQQLQQNFVRKTKGDNPMFNIFSPFFDEKNVLFQDTSIGFVSPHEVRNIPNYLTDIINKTQLCSSASSITSLSIPVLIFFKMIF